MLRARILLVTLVTTLSSPPLLAAGLPDSGQTLCDSGANVLEACGDANSGDAAPVPRQDGRFGNDPAHDAGVIIKAGGGYAGFDYSKIANDGSTLAAGAALGSGASDWACTRDNITGLVWEVKVVNASHLRHYAWSYSWYSADSATNGGEAGRADTGSADGNDNCLNKARCDTAKYVADVNAAALCSYSDWRLPTQRELASIINFAPTFLAVDTTYFPNTASPVYYWSASTYVPGPTFAWVLDFYRGADNAVDKNSPYYVRLVRGGTL